MTRSAFPLTLLPDLPVPQYGLVCERFPAWSGRIAEPMTQIACVNLVQELWPYGNCGLDWAAPGDQRSTLALCVLDHFIPRQPGEVADINGCRVPCSPDAEALHLAFAADLLGPLPYWGGRVAAESIKAWLADRGRRILSGEEIQWAQDVL